ncbi:MAG: hypothetical protein F9K46_18305 [Anaerolineae bacterium]|nr:MAG: hypothetical protein F9K46_18305 [Anaerolineae bacterium]
MDEQEKSSPIWCLVANVRAEIPYGPGGKETRRGTKQFYAGAKVFCFPVIWGDGYENIMVIGRHRSTHRYIKMIVHWKKLTNWRAELVYSPYIISQIIHPVSKKPLLDGSEEAKAEIEAYATSMRLREEALKASHDSSNSDSGS